MNGEKRNMENKELTEKKTASEVEVDGMTERITFDTHNDEEKVNKEDKKLKITSKKLTFEEIINFRQQTYEFLADNVDKLDILGDVYFKILFATYYTNLFDILPNNGDTSFDVIYEYICDIDVEKMIKGCRGFARAQLHDIMKFYNEALENAKEMERDTIPSLIYRIKGLIDIIESQITDTDVSSIMKLLEEIPKTQAEIEGSPIIAELVNALGLANDDSSDEDKQDDDENNNNNNLLS